MIARLLILALLAFGALSFERLPVGTVLDGTELRASLPPGAIRGGQANTEAGAILLPEITATTKRRDEPAALFFSNAPEILNVITLPKRRGLLATAQVGAGSVRILVSHANYFPYPMDVVLRMHNGGDENAEVVLSPRALATESLTPGRFRVDALVGAFLVQEYFKDVDAVAKERGWRPPDGVRKRVVRYRSESDAVLIPAFQKHASFMGMLTTSVPLTLSLYVVPARERIVVRDCPPVPRSGSQVRGLFEKPDCEVEATIDVSGGTPSRYAFGESERDNALGVLDGGNWMQGTDATMPGTPETVVNRGDFGGITHLTATVKGEGYGGALLMLVAGGRKVLVFPKPTGPPLLLHQWNGVVVGRVKVGETWRHGFTLPPNSWAPVYLVAVPVRKP